MHYINYLLNHSANEELDEDVSDPVAYTNAGPPDSATFLLLNGSG